ncbi:MAG TPA: hypothetical protein VH087_18100 [Thermoanaerobaculia bacterium]|nr:hypothetical protein [Thermoanaerobaculia bacterium]
MRENLMRPLDAIVAAGLILFAAGAAAQSQPATTTDTAAAAPTLVKTTELSLSDSPLVRAAKQAVASRKKQHVTVIDNEKVKHASGARMTEPTQSLPPVLPPPATGAIETPPMLVGGPPPPAGPDRAALEKRLETLKKQQELLAAAGDQPYGDDLDSEAAEKKLSTVSEEMKKLEQQLAALPKKP